MRNNVLIYKPHKGWNRSKEYIEKIRRKQNNLLRRVLPKGEKYVMEEVKE